MILVERSPVGCAEAACSSLVALPTISIMHAAASRLAFASLLAATAAFVACDNDPDEAANILECGSADCSSVAGSGGDGGGAGAAGSAGEAGGAGASGEAGAGGDAGAAGQGGAGGDTGGGGDAGAAGGAGAGGAAGEAGAGG